MPVHTEQKLTSTTPQHNCEHNRAPCPTAPSAHASYKGYGFNNSKPPRPPHRNTMIDVVVLRCGQIRTGEGAAALFIGVHILGEIRGGGFDILAESRWEDQIGPSIPVQKSTIPQKPSGVSLCSANRPWDGTAALFVATKIGGNIRGLRGVEDLANW
jgi:hypothetical protein